jgi:hypothetical protein
MFSASDNEWSPFSPPYATSSPALTDVATPDTPLPSSSLFQTPSTQASFNSTKKSDLDRRLSLIKNQEKRLLDLKELIDLREHIVDARVDESEADITEREQKINEAVEKMLLWEEELMAREEAVEAREEAVKAREEAVEAREKAIQMNKQKEMFIQSTIPEGDDDFEDSYDDFDETMKYSSFDSDRNSNQSEYEYENLATKFMRGTESEEQSQEFYDSSDVEISIVEISEGEILKKEISIIEISDSDTSARSSNDSWICPPESGF